MMLNDILFRLRALFRSGGMESELDEEVRLHLERQIAKHLEQGSTHEEAQRLARLDFGGVEQVKEQSRDARGIAMLETILRDLRYSARTLWKSPGFTIVAVLSLAFGIGANTAIFQHLDVICFQTVPVDAPEELVGIRVADMRLARGSQNGQDVLSYGLWDAVRDRQKAFSAMFAWADADFNLSPSGEVRLASGLWVSGRFFQVLGVRPAFGRVFSSDEDVRGCGTPGAVISHSFWLSEFGGDPAAIGRILRLNGHPVPVIGIMRAGFAGLEPGKEFQVAVPICSAPTLWFDAPAAGTLWWLHVMGRLRPGSSLAQATAQMRSISAASFEASLPPDYPPPSVKDYLGLKLTAFSAASGLSGLRDLYSARLTFLLGIASLVLLIACANLANLMLARASARGREIAVRLAIGASRGRVIRQLMTESFLLCAIGMSLALLLSGILSRALLLLLGDGDDSAFLHFSSDWRVLSFTACLAISTCALFGLVPALQATRSGPGPLLKSSGRGLTPGRGRFGLRRLLVASQIAFSLVLLVGALLFIASLRNLELADTGFRQGGLTIADLGFARSNPQAVQVAVFQKALLAHIQALPGVISVADTNVVPLSGNSWDNRVWMDGTGPGNAYSSLFSRVSPGYFRTLETPLLRGRDFDERDGSESAKVAIVNQVFAKRISNTPDPTGLRFRVEATPSTPETTYQIIGLVGNTKYRNLRENFEAIAYLSLSQDPAPSMSDQLLIRSSLSASSLLPALGRAIHETDPSAGFSFRTFGAQIEGSLKPERTMAALSSAFGVLAGILSAIGIYGVVTYLVERRKNEIGIRMALGADRRQIIAMVMRESAELLGIGLGGGLAMSLCAASFASSMLFGLTPYDVGTLTVSATLLAIVTLAATWLPARRASRLDPTIALRDE